MHPATLPNLLRFRALDRRRADVRGESGDSAWRQQMMPYQVRLLDAHDEQVRLSMLALRGAAP